MLLMEEILHQLIDSFSHDLQGFIHPRWLFGISEPSTVWLWAYVSSPPNYQCGVETLPPAISDLPHWKIPRLHGSTPKNHWDAGQKIYKKCGDFLRYEPPIENHVYVTSAPETPEESNETFIDV